ncbi:cytochrome o ubiquinol oxidase subunit IV [Celerinatantimonas diazotrophica]|jgi:cytochrome o ubiquinol oxidase subunit IV|uniref:Cytochrome bo(3) ubiquinol oxidase subunit 4 n=1 Tax=Celerinatantimonas diazotrophica TaxID=412034 RepID=A0A4R1JA38_9GAMM|nr:cytochrome o ubiquinol oxidase subunit IV [Celerinatantimonas diazotrophica]TCK47327.1 cytochrome bo3 quinol oxidase subunit 4 [Celerinatantimonas diazotrophica]CAG9295057.1 Cytochrome bo(3) ubiquinol oxidase subunit 4 [Celerinatantimonas diazotrophica]
MDHEHNADHGSYKSYLVGFVLAVILTVIPFYLVMNLSMSKVATLYTIFAFAVVQIVVHLKYFLHLNFTTETGRLNTISFLFSALIIGLVVGLSLWIIYSANDLMMF